MCLKSLVFLTILLMGSALMSGCGGSDAAIEPVDGGAAADVAHPDLGPSTVDQGVVSDPDQGAVPADQGPAPPADQGPPDPIDVGSNDLSITTDQGPAARDVGPDLPEVAYRAGCEPAGGTAHCALPFPSDLFSRPDPTAVTGQRLQFTEELLPRNAGRQPIRPARWNLADGFAGCAALVTTFPLPVAVDGLPDPAQLDATLADDSPLLLVDVDPASPARGSRIPLRVELQEDGRTLNLQPLLALRPGTRYVAAVRGTLRDRQGRPLPAAPAFAALRDGTPTAHAELEALRPRLEELLTALEAVHPVRRQELIQAWSFTTRSATDATRYVRTMRDEALRLLAEQGSQVTEVAIDRDDPEDEDSPPGLGGPDDDWAVKLTGLVRVPAFLQANGQLRFDPVTGLPQATGWDTVRFHLILPAAARGTQSPIPLILYGHGLFSDPWEPYWGSQQRLRERLDRAFIGVRWRGLSGAADGLRMLPVLQDLSRTPEIVDQLAQGVVDFLVLQEALLDGSLADAVAELLSREGPADLPRLSTAQADLGYLGISLGGTEGLELAALNPRPTRVVVNVPGACWSAMIPLSSQWRGEDFLVSISQVVSAAYPDPADRQLLMAFIQTLFDQADAAAVLHHLTQEGLPGPDGRPLPPPQILLQEAIGDAQVNNLITELTARSAAIPVVGPSVFEPWGIPVANDPIRDGSGLAIYRLATPAGEDPGQWAHGNLRKIPAALEQIVEFYETGVIRNHCPDQRCDELTF